VNIYKNGKGDELVKPENYNEEIRSYLEEEKKILSEMVIKYETVIEAGCMDGRYVELILDLGKKYIGIDIVKRYIKNAKKKYEVSIKKKEVSFFSVGLEKMYLKPEIIYTINTTKTIVFFPFNSFGNIKNITEAFNCLSNLQVDFVIFTYQTNSIASKVREDYYNLSGFPNLICLADDLGVRFKSSEGLDSIAYSEKYLKKTFKEKGCSLKSMNFAQIGKVFQHLNI
jgi:hypothetical protein